MRQFRRKSVTTLFISIFTLGLSALAISAAPLAFAAPAPVNLGTAAPFAILAGTEITDAGNASIINGNVGLSPATGANNDLTCLQVSGAIYSVDAAGPLLCSIENPGLLTTVKNDLDAVYTDVANRTPVTTIDTELAGQTLVAGVYDSTNTRFGITGGGQPLVLDGQNDPSSVFIFEMGFAGTGLTVGPNSVVELTRGAQACNVYWRVNTATIDTDATFVGNILALNSITVANGSDIQGRLLARNGNVTLINDTITVPACTTTPTTPVPGGGGSSGGGSTTTGATTGSSLLAPNAGVARDYSSIVLSMALGITALGLSFAAAYRYLKK